MAESKTQIISKAFVLLGEEQIQSIDDDNPIHASASAIYDTVMPSILSQRPWRFALKQFQLNKLTETPIFQEFSYIYQLPADLLSIYRFEPLDANVNYKTYIDKLYSNYSSLKIEYVYQAPESYFSHNFTLLLIYMMAENIAMNVTNQLSMAQYFEKKVAEQLSVAASIDALQVPNDYIMADDLYTAHVGY